ncbi:MAG TPA: carboxypeptidase-like regulatory domain-containing protein [Silvibacterium sp.]|nr:carboxypeptidase-like regulatory domain-containing protein [Silvibacterium sp.]
MMIALLLAFLTLLSPIKQADQVAQKHGEVEGDIVTASGAVASGFTVDVTGTSRTSTYKARAVTDDEGRFNVANLAFGSYVVIPYLDSMDSRYPPGTGSFFDKHLFRFTLSPDQPYAIVHMKLDPPFRILKGIVTDSDSGKPVIAQIRLWHADDPDKWVIFGSAFTGEYRCWIPPGQKISGVFSAPQYKPSKVSISGDSDDPNPVLNVKLEH